MIGQRKRGIDPRDGERLAEIRQNRHMSQAELAAKIGVTRGAIQSYERGRARIANQLARELAHALGCHAADLLEAPGSPLPRVRYTNGRAGS